MRQMRAAVLASACVVIGAVALGLIATDREFLAGLSVLDFSISHTSPSEAKVYPLANRDGKYDRMVTLRTDREDVEPQPALRRGDSLRQSYAAVDPVAPLPQPA